MDIEILFGTALLSFVVISQLVCPPLMWIAGSHLRDEARSREQKLSDGFLDLVRAIGAKTEFERKFND